MERLKFRFMVWTMRILIVILTHLIPKDADIIPLTKSGYDLMSDLEFMMPKDVFHV